MGRIVAVCISRKKGTAKEDIGECRVIEDHGLENDAHAGSERQVSLLSIERVNDFRERSRVSGKTPPDLKPGIFGENLLVEGYDLNKLSIGTRLRSGEVILEITRIGKECHTGCEIRKLTGECIMPSNGVFAKVVKGGLLKDGDEILLTGEEVRNTKALRASIITASDRAFKGERKDESGPRIRAILLAAGYEVISEKLLSDDMEGIIAALSDIADNEAPDVIFTTGGTGFSVRDNMPEATKAVADRDVPGISEGMRAYSMKYTNKAILSRGVSVIRKRTLIVNLPGSPKAVTECLEFLLPVLEHGLLILRGEADD